MSAQLPFRSRMVGKSMWVGWEPRFLNKIPKLCEIIEELLSDFYGWQNDKLLIQSKTGAVSLWKLSYCRWWPHWRIPRYAESNATPDICVLLCLLAPLTLPPPCGLGKAFHLSPGMSEFATTTFFVYYNNNSSQLTLWNLLPNFCFVLIFIVLLSDEKDLILRLTFGEVQLYWYALLTGTESHFHVMN